MPYETTRSPKLCTRARDVRVLALLARGIAVKDVARRLRLTQSQVYEASRRHKLFYAKKSRRR